MAALGKTFRPMDHDTEQTDFELLPTGIYQLEVTASDIKEQEGGTAMNATIEVVAPEEYHKRRFFIWIDTDSDDPKKQADGQRDLARLSRAMFGADAPESIDDSEEFHFHTFTALVENSPAGVSKAGKPYRAKNRIKRYYFPDEANMPEPAIDATQPAAAPATRPVAANNNQRPAANQNASAAPAKAAGARPWGKK